MLFVFLERNKIIAKLQYLNEIISIIKMAQLPLATEYTDYDSQEE